MTGVPLENGEHLQILKYELNQHYKGHRDFFESVHELDGYQRIVTCLMYLSDPDEGGETNFPLGIPTQEFKEQHKHDKLSKCASYAAAHSVKPRKGDALVFHSLDAANQYVDRLSLHQGCDVLGGIKWSSTIWMHQESFRINEIPTRDGGPCSDLNAKCKEWAKVGECTRNQRYMRSSCRKACGLC